MIRLPPTYKHPSTHVLTVFPEEKISKRLNIDTLYYRRILKGFYDPTNELENKSEKILKGNEKK